MSGMGGKIAEKRKDLGLTQQDLADKLSVTRQTVSRWEAGTVMPDIEKLTDIADYLGVSCDYLLRDDVSEEKHTAPVKGIGRLLESLKGRTVVLSFFDEEADADLMNLPCVVTDFEGNWMKVTAERKKGRIEKLIPLSSVLSFELREEEE